MKPVAPPIDSIVQEQDNLELNVNMLQQPDDSTCGPTCLHAVYRYFGDLIPLHDVIDESQSLDGGGTLDVFLANHALKRGYSATIYTYNLTLFDPSWFEESGKYLMDKLSAQLVAKSHPKLEVATNGYLEFLQLGGNLRFVDLTPRLIRRLLNKKVPILTGLSATYLYRSKREMPDCSDDDIRGDPVGHFVILSGYDKTTRLVTVMDPEQKNPIAETQRYKVSVDRICGAILLGALTYDANLLFIQPKSKQKSSPYR